MLRCLLLFLLAGWVSGCASQRQLKPFVTDGCSLCPDGNWRTCCVVHDRAYWRGGSAVDRWNADCDLFSCVREQTNFVWASVMFAGVRFGGFPLWPTPWRWGFGWSYPRWYGSLSDEERDDIRIMSGP